MGWTGTCQDAPAGLAPMNEDCDGREMVPRMRFELIRPYGHCPLKTACLPISPPGHGTRLAGVEGLEPPTGGFGDRCSSS